MSASLPILTPTTAAAPVPVAFLGRTSTLVMQDPVQSLGRQLREVQAKLPPGWFIAAHYWDIESGGMDLDQRGHGTAHQGLEVGIPLPAPMHAQVYEVLSLELLYSHQTRQALIRATITTRTRTALAAIIRQDATLPPELAAAFSDLEHNPGTPGTRRDHDGPTS